jgi:hypothetical protein
MVIIFVVFNRAMDIVKSAMYTVKNPSYGRIDRAKRAIDKCKNHCMDT